MLPGKVGNWKYKGRNTVLKNKAISMAIEEKILNVSKEIVVKFIEVGRVSPASFPETFKDVYRAVKEAVEEGAPPEDADDE